jgi:hypothetical protein
MPQLIEFEAANPFRLPNWRHTRALAILEHPEGPKRSSWRDDNYVRELRRFLLEHRSAAGDPGRLNAVGLEHPEQYFAHEFYRRNKNSGCPLTTVLEARLLAG